MKKPFLILFFLLPLLNLSAQQLYFKSQDFLKIHENAEVNTVCETSNGYLWFGTSEGLFRYDGAQFKKITPVDSSIHLEVSALYQAPDQRLWVGCTKGNILYTDHRNQLTRWMPEEGTPAVPITAFEQTKDGVLWIATYGEGLYYLQHSRLYNMNMEDGLAGNDIYTLCKTPDDEIWIGTDSGINICNLKGRTKQITQLSKSDGLPDEIVKALHLDHLGNMWVGMYDHGVAYYDRSESTFSHVTPDWKHGIVNCLESFQGKELWIGTEGRGLYRMNLDSYALELLPSDKLSNSKIFDLHKDAEGNLWVINHTSGILTANRHFEQLPHQLGSIQAVLADSRKRLWIGTQAGLYQMTKDAGGTPGFEPHLSSSSLNVVSLFEDRYQNIWIGTFGDGLYCYNPQAEGQKPNYRQLTEKDGLTNGSVLSIAGSATHIWLATLGGVTEFRYDSIHQGTRAIDFQNFNHESSLGTNFIYKVFIDGKGRTWFGTDGKGISRLENGNITNYFEAGNIPLKAVYAITEDRHGNIWFSTAEDGLFEFDGQQFNHLSVKDGLRDRRISGLATDHKGHVVIAHASGIDVLNPDTRQFISFDEELGLGPIEPGLNAICADPEGNIWIGTAQSLLKYTALSESFDQYPRTLIESVKIFYEPADFHSVNTFAYDQNNLAFEYIGLWYSDPLKVRYRYQLEGYDLDWIHSKDRQAHYSNLPPGHYNFKIASTRNQTFGNEPVASYSFTVKAPFWKRSWFILLILLVLVTALYGWMKWRENRFQREAALKKERIEGQLEVLKSQINPHFLFNSFNTLNSLIEQNPQLATEYVEKLSDFYRSILQHRNKDLITIEEELEMVENFTFLLKKRFGENLQLLFNIHNDEPIFIAPLTLQMLIENAIKHNIISKARPLIIRITVAENWIEVTNNLQKKLTHQPSTQFGLQSIVSKYSLLSGLKVKIERNDNYFKVAIPIIKNAYI